MRIPSLLFVVLLTACGATARGAPSATASATGAFDCAGTKPPNPAPPSLAVGRPDQNEAFTTGPLFVHRNDSLAVRLPVDGRMFIDAGRDGVKLGWVRLKTGALSSTSRRLDQPGTVEVDLADNYGESGLQVTGIRFRAPGCYEVTARVANGPPLTFITRVELR